MDDDTNSIVEWKWQLLPVDNNLAQPDPEIEKLIATFQEEVDRKYNRLIGRLARQLTHPKREEETDLGNLIADIVAQLDNIDVVPIGSASIRGTKLGPLVTLSDLKIVLPYDGVLYKLKVTGVQLTQIFAYIMRLENRMSEDSCCFQVSKGIQAVYSDSENQLASLSINGQPVQVDAKYTIC
ncbi:5'-nucleotidase C-terminal domain-containing protein [Microcoleus sp. N3A4]|uniref:5'-nucleotidase C-terminal domain-containing protein n=1 Tax=Microcoleus sp. N3A4 TaxID=3055379 RepID=UPI002FD6428A